MSAIAWTTTVGALLYLCTIAFAVRHTCTLPIERLNRNTLNDAIPLLILGYMLTTYVHFFGATHHLLDTADIQLVLLALLYAIGALIASVVPLRITTALVRKHRSQNV